MKARSRSTRSTGFGLLECLFCALLLASLTALAAPAMGRLLERQRLRAVAESLHADLQQARTTALASGRTVRVRLDAHVGGSCILIHAGAADSCRCEDGGAAVCVVTEDLLKHQWLPARSGLRYEGSVRQISFHPRYGSASSAGRFNVRSRGGTIQQVVALNGRVRRCASAGIGFGLPVCEA